jgi:hypothetical protein
VVLPLEKVNFLTPAHFDQIEFSITEFGENLKKIPTELFCSESQIKILGIGPGA